MFCPKCGSLLMPKTVGKQKVIACRCGYKSEETKQLEIKETRVDKGHEMTIIDENEGEAMPEVDEECPKCKNKKSYFWLAQTRAGDEPETRFFKCTKCKHTWREYA